MPHCARRGGGGGGGGGLCASRIADTRRGSLYIMSDFAQWLFLRLNPEWSKEFNKLLADADTFFKAKGVDCNTTTKKSNVLLCTWLWI